MKNIILSVVDTEKLRKNCEKKKICVYIGAKARALQKNFLAKRDFL